MQMASSKLVLVSSFLVFLVTLSFAAYPDRRKRCIDYAKSSASIYNSSAGSSPGRVSAVTLCRGDQNVTSCTSCLSEAVSDLMTDCLNSQQGYIWLELCSVYYSSQEVNGNLRFDPYDFVPSSKNVTDLGLKNISQFNLYVNPFFNNLISQAAAGGSLHNYAVGNSTEKDFLLTLYGLVQCTPDLSQCECTQCLNNATSRITSVCNGLQGCRILQPSCNLRYETYQFYTTEDNNVHQPISAPPPQPSPPPSSPHLSPPPSSPEGNGSNRTRTIIIAAVSSFISILSLVLCVWICLKHKRPERIVETAANEMIKVESLQYDFATISVATNNFCDGNKLGRGGFGSVYKGKLQNGQEVAVKRLSSGSRQGDSEFKNEVLLLAKLQHRNLVRLLGFCLERDERLLIYEFLPNSSLDRFIFDPIKRLEMDWERRYKIIAGIARGLLYLHQDSHLRIIHCDLKASNILLDEDINSKIADFGMARLFVSDELHGNTSKIGGTYGYMAPEYAMYGHFSLKSDVYSFGVLILEIVSGKKKRCFRSGDSLEDPLQYVWKLWREGPGIDLIDPTLKSNGLDTAEMMKCIHIGLLCVQENVVDRPTMANIVQMLSGNSTALTEPSEPRFFMHRHNAIEDGLLPDSANEVSITELYPR